jgi:hypothetical protein
MDSFHDVLREVQFFRIHVKIQIFNVQVQIYFFCHNQVQIYFFGHNQVQIYRHLRLLTVLDIEFKNYGH